MKTLFRRLIEQTTTAVKMRCLSFIPLLMALIILVSSEECEDTCPDDFDIHCATDGTCYHLALSACSAKKQSCYREKRGLPAFTNIHRGYCRWGLPRCKTYKD